MNPMILMLFKRRIDTAGLSSEAKEKITSEFNKFKMMSPMSAEATVVRNYIDTVLSLPWKDKSEVNSDIAHAQKYLTKTIMVCSKLKREFWNI